MSILDGVKGGENGPIASNPRASRNGSKTNRNGNEVRLSKEIYVQQYHIDDLLAEAIIIGTKSYFAVATRRPETPSVVSIGLQESIDFDEDIVLKPLPLMSYLSKPYTFKDRQDFDKHIYDCRNETMDSLYAEVKSEWSKYIDADDFHLSLCAADTIYTYYQDKIGLTHYLFFIGDNASGKSNNLRVINTLAYRNFLSTDLTAANVYQFLGSFQEGQGTLCVDEADQIDSNNDIMRICKNGSIEGFPVARVDTSSGRTQHRFFTFGFKAFAAERSPDSVTAKGFNQRIIPLQCTYGTPQYDITEVMNPAGEEEYEGLREKLYRLRNKLLIYRIYHFHDKLPNIKLSLTGRERQLFMPTIRVFQNTQVLHVLCTVIGNYISKRREANANTLHAFLYHVIMDLIKTENTAELKSTMIWNKVTSLLPGKDLPNKPLSYDCSEFGTISQKRIVETLIQVFGAKQSNNRREERRLIFDVHKLQRLGQIYDLSVEVKVRVGTDVTDMTDVTHIGLDKHLYEPITMVEDDNHNDQDIPIFNSENKNNEETTLENTNKDPPAPVHSSVHPSHVSHTSQPIEASSTNNRRNDSIYRTSEHSDVFACQNCSNRGDRFFMEVHECNMSKQEKRA